MQAVTEQSTVQVYGSAVVVGIFRSKWLEKGKTLRHRERFVDTWVKITAHGSASRPLRSCLAQSDMMLRVFGGRTSEQWIAQYSSSHQHPVNRLCHTLGIPTILLAGAVLVVSIFFHRLWLYALGLFVIGWIFQFVGHAFEGKPPEFFHDWRFLFVGVRWWWAKIHGKA